MLDAFKPNAQLFNADVELHRLLLATERKPTPFITIMQFGLQLQSYAVPVAQGVPPQPLGEPK